MNEASYAAIGTILGVVLSGIAAAIIKLWDAQHKYRKEDREGLSTEFHKLIDRLQVDYAKLDAKAQTQELEIARIRVRERRYGMLYELAVAHMRYLEEVMERGGLQFRKWVEPKSDDSMAGSQPTQSREN